MKFKANVKQIKKVMALACEASKPVGMGFAQFQKGQKFTPDMFEVRYSSHGASASIDYAGGRMVKLALFAEKSWTSDSEVVEWRVTDSNPSSAYQSWCYKYPTYAELLSGAGIKVEEQQ